MALAAPAVAPSGATAAVPRAAYCRVLDLSPAFQQDGTAFCATASESALVVYRTKDRGRSWTRLASAGVRIPDGATVTQVVMSADYANDRTVYIATSSVLYVSQDDGATFLPLDLLTADGSGRRVMTRYLDTTSGLPVAYLAFASYDAPARLRPPLHEAVVGPRPAKTFRFLIPSPVTPGSDVLVLGFSGSGADLAHTIYECTAVLACTTARGTVKGLGGFSGIWIPPTYAGDKTLYAAGAGNGFTFVRSTDGGRTFRPWTGLNSALRPVTSAMTKRAMPQLSLPALAFAGGKIYVRVFSHLPDDGKLPPFQVILRSDDRGATWRQVAAQYDTGGRRRGNLPFTHVGNTTRENDVQLYGAPDGRVFAMGEGLKDAGAGPWCSVDGGVRWHRVCPK